MKFETSPLYTEMLNVIKNGSKHLPGFYECKLRVNNKEITAVKVLNVDQFRDFKKNYCDDINIEIMLPAGVYENDILPYKENIDVKIYHRVNTIDPNRQDLSKPVALIEGRGILSDPSNSHFSLNSSVTGKDQRDLTSMINIQMQVLDPMIEVFRMASVGGIFRATTGMEFIKTLFMNISNNAKVSSEYRIKGVNVVEGFNKNIKNHINIESGTTMIDLPDYVNENVEGIYPTGLGFYLYKRIWHFYPLYDIERVNKTKKTLTIIRVPKDVLPQTDVSYIVDHDNVTILCNRKMEYTDPAQHEHYNKGNGLRFVDASKVISGFVTVDGNKITADRAKIVNEFVGEKSPTGLNNLVTPDSTITANSFYQMSKLAQRSGGLVTMTWEYSNCDVIYPGMPVKIKYLQGDNVGTLEGVVLGVQTTIVLEGQGMQAKHHKEVSVLSIFVKRKLDWNPS